MGSEALARPHGRVTKTAVRPAAVAGRFYPARADRLRRLLDALVRMAGGSAAPARAVIVPHAGLEYSGLCAAHVFTRVAIPATVVLLAPNHTGRLGSPHGASLWSHGAFETPLGDVPVDGAFADALAARSPFVAHDPVAHEFEHAIEVELPFLQVLARDVAVVPLVLAHDAWPLCEGVAGALAETVRSCGRPVLLVASSDMIHDEPAASAAMSVAGASDQIAIT